jgi:PAS domain S-box-containing protein
MTPSVGSVILQLVPNVSLLALAVIGYAVLRRRTDPNSWVAGLGIGAVFGLVAILAMSFSVHLAPGVIVDGRSILIGLASLVGGALATFVTVTLIAVYRIWLGGAGALAGVVGTIVSGLVAIGICRIWRRYRIKPGIAALALLGFAVVTAGSACFILLNPELEFDVIVERVIPLYVMVPLGTVIFGIALLREDSRFELQARHRDQVELFDAIFRSMSDGVTVVNAKGEIVMVNPMSQALAGVGETTLPSSEWANAFGVFQPDGKTLFPEPEMPLVRALRGTACDDVEMVVKNSNNERQRLLNVSGRPLLGHDGRIKGAVAVFRDITEQKAMADALRSSNARFKDAIDAMEDGFGLFDADDRVVLYNEAFLDDGTRKVIGDPTGHKFEEVVRAFAYHAMPVTDPNFDREAWITARMERHRNPPKTPIEVPWSGGRWMRISERRTADGGYVGIWTDVTAIHQARDRLVDAIESLSDGFALFDRKGELVICNETFRKSSNLKDMAAATGLTMEAILRRFLAGSAIDMKATKDPEAWIRWRLARHANPPEEPYEQHLTDGRWLSITERVTSEGGRVGIWTDITALKAAEQRLHDAIDSINEGFALFDSEMRYVIYNRQLLDLYPASASAVAKGVRFEDVLRYGAEHGEYANLTTIAEIDDFVRDWMKCFTAADRYVGEGALADGRWVLVSHHRTPDGGYVTVRTDITAQKLREFELQRTKEQLEAQASKLVDLAATLEDARRSADRANKDKSRFLAGMSHELRTPLNAILGFSDTMRYQIFGQIEPPRYREYVELIHESGAHLLSLINDLLDISKIEAGKMELNIVEVPTDELAAGLVALMRNLAEARRISLSSAVDATCPVLHADQRAARQIAINLLSNAVKFTPAGGRVSLSIVNRDNEGAEIVVSDTGAGMTPDEVARALEPYGQAGESLDLRLKGTGLGLPLTKALVELHGGRMTIASEKGKGTTVTVLLPWQQQLARPKGSAPIGGNPARTAVLAQSDRP